MGQTRPCVFKPQCVSTRRASSAARRHENSDIGWPKVLSLQSTRSERLVAIAGRVLDLTKGGSVVDSTLLLRAM